MAENHYDVLVLGGGFAGVYCAKQLAKAKGMRVALCAKENHMVFQPLLAEVAAASVSPRHVVNPLRHMCRKITVLKGEVKQVDHSVGEVHLSAGDFTPDVVLRYRQLVLSLGATIDLSRVPGMTEHALLMQNVGDAMKLRATLISRFEEANLVLDRERRRTLLRFVVVGGGYSGVETAGEIHDLMREVHRYYTNVDWDDFEVVLVHSRPHILPSLSRGLREFARDHLSRRGIRMLLGRRVSAVTAQSVSLDDGSAIATCTVISTIGNAPHPVVLDLARKENLALERGRLQVNASGQVLCADGLWAAGDCCAWPMPKRTGEVCPATAQFAQRQGTLVGENLMRRQRHQPLKRFEFAGLGELAAIGNRTAVAEVMGIRLSGFFAWWLWRSIYVAKLPGLQRKLRVVLDWTLDLFFPRDINLLNPQYTRLLRETYLLAGDVLYRPGEPAFSVYFVKSGHIQILDGEFLVKEVGPGESFGERTLMGDKTWRYRAVATAPSLVIALSAREFSSIVEGSDALKRVFERAALSSHGKDEFEALRARLDPATISATIAELMTKEVDTLSPSMTVQQAMEQCQRAYRGSYPLVDHAGVPQGVVRRDDVFDYIKGHGSYATDLLARVRPVQLPLVPPEQTGGELLERFMRSGRNKALVVDADGKLVGIVTMLDLLKKHSD